MWVKGWAAAAGINYTCPPRRPPHRTGPDVLLAARECENSKYVTPGWNRTGSNSKYPRNPAAGRSSRPPVTHFPREPRGRGEGQGTHGPRPSSLGCRGSSKASDKRPHNAAALKHESVTEKLQRLERPEVRVPRYPSVGGVKVQSGRPHLRKTPSRNSQFYRNPAKLGS